MNSTSATAASAVNDVLCRLLRAALGTSREPAGVAAVPAALWPDVLAAARAHTVSALVFRAVEASGEAESLPDAVSIALLTDAERLAARSRRMRSLSAACLDAAAKEGLSLLPLKGPAVAAYYPDPDLRASGDLDFYLSEGQKETAAAWLARLGSPVEEKPDGSLAGQVNGIDLDLHAGYFDLPVPAHRMPPVPSPEATLLQLSLHVLKHAMGPGAGLRQVCDVAMACRTLDGQYDRQALLAAFRASGTLRWNRVLSAFIRRRLGVDTGWFPGEKEVSCRFLEKIVFTGGNFGHHDAGRKAALYGDSAWRRKTDTALRFVLRAPFMLRCAPRPYLRHILTLAGGNL